MSRPFTVVAILAAHNEADVIEHVIRDLIAQGLVVYYIDDDSTDGTLEIVERYVGRGVRGIERFDSTPGSFEWGSILRRKTALAQSLDADWFIHHDADEFREGPWSGVSLLESVRRADEVGCNAIDFRLLDFHPDHDGFVAGTDVREAFQYYSEAAPYNRRQVRCWRKTSAEVDLITSGGHEALFPNRVIFPINFLLRHYPIRGQAHGTRKVFTDRRPRFVECERRKGWHVQYEDCVPGMPFTRDRSTLQRYDAVAVRRTLVTDERGHAERQASELRLQIAEQQAQLDASRVEAAQSRAEAAASLALAASAEARCAALETRSLETTAAYQLQVAALTQDAVALRAELARTVEGVRYLQARVGTLEQSLSWRWTAPARAALRFLTGR